MAIDKYKAFYIRQSYMNTMEFLQKILLIKQLINKATFFAAQEKLNAPCKTRQNHTDFAYNETMFCSKCGCQMTGEVKRKKRKDGTERKYIYYHCTGNRGGDCKKDSYIREELIDKTILDNL